VSTSARKWEITFEVAAQGLAAEASYALRAQITREGPHGWRVYVQAFKGSELEDGRIAFTESWKPEKLWDTHTPQNSYEVRLSLLDGEGKVLDAALPERFGFREFWIEGRDFYLKRQPHLFVRRPHSTTPRLERAGRPTKGRKRASNGSRSSASISSIRTITVASLGDASESFRGGLEGGGMMRECSSRFSQPHFGQYQ